MLQSDFLKVPHIYLSNSSDLFQSEFGKQFFDETWTTLGYETSLFFIKIATPIVVLAGKSFIGTNLIFGILTAFISYEFYSSFLKYFKSNLIVVAICLLFVPSLNFWCSGFSKDTLLLLGIYIITPILYFKEIKKNHLIPILLISYVLIKLKLVLFACLLLGWSFFLISRCIPISKFFQNGLLALIIAIAITSLFYYLITSIGYFKELSFSTVASNDLESLSNTDKKNVTLWSYFSLPFTLILNGFNTYSVPIFSGEDFPFKQILKIETLLILVGIILSVMKNFTSTPNQNTIFILSLALVLISFGIAISLGQFNIGTILRYRAPLIPYVSLIILISFYPKASE